MDFKQALDVLIQQVIEVVKDLVNKAPYDKTYKGVIQSSTASGSAYVNKVLISGRNKSIKSKQQYSEGDYVYVLVPCGEWQNAFILASGSGTLVIDNSTSTISLDS